MVIFRCHLDIAYFSRAANNLTFQQKKAPLHFGNQQPEIRTQVIFSFSWHSENGHFWSFGASFRSFSSFTICKIQTFSLLGPVRTFDSALSGLRKYLATEGAFKNDAKRFSFHLKVNFKIYDVATGSTNN